jgi:hypothetical protein
MHDDVLALCEEKFKQLDSEKITRETGERELHRRISESKKEVEVYIDEVKKEMKEDVSEIGKAVKTFEAEFKRLSNKIMIGALLLAGSAITFLSGTLINLAIEKIKSLPIP